MSSVVLTPEVTAGGKWRVKMAWPAARCMGKFNSQAEAERWIAEHQWLIEQRQEPGLPRQEYGKGTSDHD